MTEVRRESNQISGTNVLLDRATHLVRERHQRACDAAWAASERSPIIREGRILPIHDYGNLRHVGQACLQPQLRLTFWPEERAPRRMDLSLVKPVSSTARV